MTRYREAFHWTNSIDHFIQWEIKETPLLHVCSGRSRFGDTTLDLHEPADIQADWTNLPLPDDSYAAVFADPPWDSGHKMEASAFMKEALRIAPIAYLMSPWIYCAEWAPITKLWWREYPGIHNPILLVRYQRPQQLRLL